MRVTDSKFVHLEGVHFFFEVVGEDGELKDGADEETKDHAEEIIVFEEVEVEAGQEEYSSQDEGVEDAS